jgi:DUF1680 family protein
LVYCLEQLDNAGAPVGLLRLPRDAKADTSVRDDICEGMIGIVAEGRAAEVGSWDGDLYRSAPPGHAAAQLSAVPYYSWNNRGPNRMLVWISES